MTDKKEYHQWLQWANELQSIGQSGLTYSENPFDLQRFRRVLEISAEILSHQSFESFEKIRDLLSQEEHYLTPKLDVRTAIIQDNKILLVQEVSDGKWTMPGGYADVNESPAESAKKEVFEETGYVVDIIKLYAFVDKQKRNYPPQIPHTHKCFFIGKIMGGEPRTSIETTAVQFFDKDNLPELSQHRVMAPEIELAFTHYHQLDLPTSFD